MKKILTCLMAALGLTTACGQANQRSLAEGKSNYENTDVKGFAELRNDTNVVVLDVRTAEEFKEGHLDGAVNIDYKQNDFVEQAVASLPKNRTIAVYCRSGRRSASAAELLAKEGYRVVNMKGGIIAWQEAQMPVTTADGQRHRGENQAL